MLILLVGPKGSGKSYEGRLLEQSFGVHFFHVEPHWLRYHEECAATGRPVRIAEGIDRVHPLIEDALSIHQHVIVETTGASGEILDDLLSLGERVEGLLVYVDAPLSRCLERIARRDRTDHIPVGEADVRSVHAVSSAVDLPFDIVRQNDDLTEEEILRPFRTVGFGVEWRFGSGDLTSATGLYSCASRSNSNSSSCALSLRRSILVCTSQPVQVPFTSSRQRPADGRRGGRRRTCSHANAAGGARGVEDGSLVRRLLLHSPLDTGKR